MELHGGPHAVLEDLEEHVVEMGGDVGELDVLGAGIGRVLDAEIQLRRVHVHLVAQELSVFEGGLSNL